MAVLLVLLTLFNFPAGKGFKSNALLQHSDSLIARNWTVEDGLPVNDVNVLLQDEKGYLWFTTYDGIVRFDGIHFKVFNHSNTPGMPQNRAVFMREQKGTGIWVSLENGGVVLINKKGLTHFGKDQGFTNADVTYMHEDSQGCMWFGTYGGLYKYKNGHFSRAFTRQTAPQNNISFIYEDKDHTLWITTHDGLVHLKDDSVKVYNYKPGTVHNEFTEIRRSLRGRLWIGSRTGLYVLQDGKLQKPAQFNQLAGQYVNAIYVDKKVQLISTDRGFYRYDGHLVKLEGYDTQYKSYQQFYRDSRGLLWMIKNNGMLAWFIDGKIVPVKNPESLGEYHFNRVTEDREGDIWLTTARHGVVRVKHSKVRTIGKPEGLTGNNILGLFEDSRGRFWVGTRDEGLNIIDGKKITQFRESGRIPSDIVQSIAEDKKGNIWVGYYQHGLQRFTDKGLKSYDLGFGPRVNDIRAIYVSRDSTIWLGTYGGLVKFDPDGGKNIVYTTKDGLAGNLVRYIDGDRNGGLWIGTADGGVSYFKEGAFKNYTMQQGLSSNNIRAVYVDEYEPGTVWVGTENKGLNRIRANGIASLGVQEGLPDHIIHYISQDKYGWLWMSSNRGVFKIKKQDLNNFLDGQATYFNMIHYGREAGMRNPECNGSFQQGGLRTTHGTFWFATQQGVAIFKVHPRLSNKVPPAVNITNMVADGKSYAPKNVAFESGVNDFQVNFNAVTFASPGQTHFRYKLEGHDKHWNEVINKRQVSYRNVPAGHYTFRVLAANNDGIWSPEGAAADIRISLLFYQHAWFYMVIFLLLILGYYVISHLRYRYLMKKQEQMQQTIDEQTSTLRHERDEIKKQNDIIEEQAHKLEESNKAKDRFFSIIGHDLRNPFQALVGYSSLLLEDYQNMDSEEIREGLLEIEKASDRLLDLVENLLKWASLQTGKIVPSPEWCCLNELVDHNIKLLTQTASQKDITLTFEANGRLQILTDKNMINTVVRNLLSNAIKFTHRGGNVTLKTWKRDGTCSLRVTDTGIGMSKEMMKKLMKLDETTSRFGTENEAGTGLGLIICKEMVMMNGGNMAIESTEGAGTTFKVSFPQKTSPKDKN